MRNKILALIASFCFIVFSFLTVVDFCCFDRSFYTKEHNSILLGNKHIADYIGVSDENLSKITDVTLDYLRDRNKTLDLKLEVNGTEREIFTDYEKEHMVDVRNLYLNAMTVRNISLIIMVISLGLLIYFNKKDSLFYITKYYPVALIVSLFIICCLGVAIFTNFDAFWNSFHHVFFSGNELWILDLSKDILIMIVPPEFFNHLVVRIVLMFFTILTITGILCYIYKKKAKYD